PGPSTLRSARLILRACSRSVQEGSTGRRHANVLRQEMYADNHAARPCRVHFRSVEEGSARRCGTRVRYTGRCTRYRPAGGPAFVGRDVLAFRRLSLRLSLLLALIALKNAADDEVRWRHRLAGIWVTRGRLDDHTALGRALGLRHVVLALDFGIVVHK